MAISEIKPSQGQKRQRRDDSRMLVFLRQEEIYSPSGHFNGIRRYGTDPVKRKERGALKYHRSSRSHPSRSRSTRGYEGGEM